VCSVFNNTIRRHVYRCVRRHVSLDMQTELEGSRECMAYIIIIIIYGYPIYITSAYHSARARVFLASNRHDAG